MLIRIYEEVTSKKQQQKIIQQQLSDLSNKNEELRKYIESNGELENFAYVASHDLQAPLRTISSFTGLLRRRIEEHLGKDEREYMDFIINATKDMQILIRDLLTYSRVNTNKCQFVPLNVSRAVEDVLLQLKSTIDEKQAQIHFQGLPDYIEGDLVKVRQLFQNLITNALKFTKPDCPPIVNIACKEQNNEWLFSVSDNGIGIEQENQDAIFMLFRRLHTNSDFQGTGIGLSLCKKIVEQHGGLINVQSELGSGCTFHFSFRKKLIS